WQRSPPLSAPRWALPVPSSGRFPRSKKASISAATRAIPLSSARNSAGSPPWLSNREFKRRWSTSSASSFTTFGPKMGSPSVPSKKFRSPAKPCQSHERLHEHGGIRQHSKLRARLLVVSRNARDFLSLPGPSTGRPQNRPRARSRLWHRLSFLAHREPAPLARRAHGHQLGRPPPRPRNGRRTAGTG